MNLDETPDPESVAPKAKILRWKGQALQPWGLGPRMLIEMVAKREDPAEFVAFCLIYVLSNPPEKLLPLIRTEALALVVHNWVVENKWTEKDAKEAQDLLVEISREAKR